MSQKQTGSRAMQTPPQSRPAQDSAAPPPPEAWRGHHSVTRLALKGILERARSGTGSATLDERVLANVCELRRAAASGEWLGRLRTDCLGQLAAARFALNEIGAMSVAAYFSDTMRALRSSCSRQQRQAALVKLARDFNAVGPFLDALIAKYAQALLDAGSRAGSPRMQ